MKDEPTDSSRNTWVFSPGAGELQPRVSQELSESVFLLLCGGDSSQVSGHMHLSLEETWAGKRFGSPLHRHRGLTQTQHLS